MIQDTVWIGAIDHRISASIVFFLLMLVLNTAKKRGQFALRAGATLAVMCLASWVLRSLSDEWLQDIRLQGLCVSAQILALNLLFLAGSRLCYRVNPSENLYHSLLAILTVVDRNLGEVENASRLTMADSAEIRREADTPQLNLLADLLEQAYTQREEEWAEEIISEISFYLHRKGIDTLDYSPDRSKWFDMMPAQSDGTLRPALVEDGVLLKKGLAAAVYRN